MGKQGVSLYYLKMRIFRILPRKLRCYLGDHSWWFNMGWSSALDLKNGVVERRSWKDDNWTCSHCGKVLDLEKTEQDTA